MLSTNYKIASRLILLKIIILQSQRKSLLSFLSEKTKTSLKYETSVV